MPNAQVGTRTLRGLLIACLAVLVIGLTLTAYQVSALRAAGQAEVAGEPVTFRSPPMPLLRPIDERVFSVAFSPDGTKLITAGGMRAVPGQLKIWNVPAGDECLKLRGIRGVRTAAFSPDGKTFATGDFAGDIKLRDADTGAEKGSVKAHPPGINGIAFSQDGASLVSAGLDNIAKLWTVKGLAERKAFRGHTDMIYSIALFHHGEAFVTGSKDNTAKIWNIRTGKEKFTLQGHTDAIETVAVSPDDKIVATGSWDGKVKFWNAETGAETGDLNHGDAIVFAIAFSGDGKLLASAGNDGKVRLWDVKKRNLVKILGEHWVGVIFVGGRNYAALPQKASHWSASLRYSARK